jgi:hypothetical protein
MKGIVLTGQPMRGSAAAVDVVINSCMVSSLEEFSNDNDGLAWVMVTMVGGDSQPVRGTLAYVWRRLELRTDLRHTSKTLGEYERAVEKQRELLAAAEAEERD